MSDVGKILKSYLNKKRQVNSGYSMRALARDLDVAPSFLSAVLSGKRKLPKRFYKSLQKILDIAPDDMSRIRLDRVDEEDLPEASTKTKSKTDITEWKLVPTRSFLSHWYLPALLDLMSCETFKSDEKWIAKKLGITNAEVDFALRELQRLELVRENKDGKWEKIDQLLRMTSSESKAEFRKFHSQILKKAMEELSSQESSESRQISGMTVGISKKQIPMVKKRLSDFFHELAKDLNETSGEDVFYLGVNFFPLTKLERSSDGEQN